MVGVPRVTATEKKKRSKAARSELTRAHKMKRRDKESQLKAKNQKAPRKS